MTTGLLDLRLRSRITTEELEQKVGKILTPGDVNVVLTGPAFVRKPDGKPLLVYLPQALGRDILDRCYPTLHDLRRYTTENRGLASGMQRTRRSPGGRTRTTEAVPSAIIGAFDPVGPKQYCRLTAFTRDEGQRYAGLFPLFQAIALLFRQYVPDRFQAQMLLAEETEPEWVVPGTPFTTITVNNSYATGVHTDSGDLDEGFSTLACLRYGEYQGGWLCFPEYRVGVDMQHGDVLLMDAHEFHGNVALNMQSEDAERISVVCYYRSKMASCGTAERERERAREYAERHNLAMQEAQ